MKHRLKEWRENKLLNTITQDFGSKQGRFEARCCASKRKSNAVLGQKTSENIVNYFGYFPKLTIQPNNLVVVIIKVYYLFDNKV